MSPPPKSKADLIRVLLSNPTTRKMVINTARKAAGTVSAAAAKVRSSASASESEDVAKAAPPPSAEKPAFTQFLPLGNLSGSVEKIVNNVAKPVAERMAASNAGRSVLAAVNHITSDALKGPTTANGVTSTEPGATNTDAGKPEEPKTRFVPVQPKAGSTPPPVQTLKWPPPKHSQEG